jgi:hypothetical protein
MLLPSALQTYGNCVPVSVRLYGHISGWGITITTTCLMGSPIPIPIYLPEKKKSLPCTIEQQLQNQKPTTLFFSLHWNWNDKALRIVSVPRTGNRQSNSYTIRPSRLKIPIPVQVTITAMYSCMGQNRPETSSWFWSTSVVLHQLEDDQTKNTWISCLWVEIGRPIDMID